MRLRQNITPKSYQDLLITAFVVVIMPLIYWFELFVVMPNFYNLWSPWYNFHFLMGTFIFLNTTSNFVCIILCDTSIKGIMMPATLKENWRLCSICECIAPPRSWHCSTCKTCILTRDHHCRFTSCCIGHHNMRFFLMFVLYVFVATVYATYYNVNFIINSADLITWKSIFKLVFPLVMVFVEWTMKQCFLFLVLIVTLSSCFTGVLLYYHLRMIFDGIVTFERKFKNRPYDLGRKKNVMSVLGDRWYLIWICPFVESKLSHDGINWVAKDTEKAK